MIMLHSSILLGLQAAIITLSPSILVDELFWLSLESKALSWTLFDSCNLFPNLFTGTDKCIKHTLPVSIVRWTH